MHQLRRTNQPARIHPQYGKYPAQLRQQEFAWDNEEAEIGVGCIGVLIHDANHEVVAGLSVSAPIERRKNEWVNTLKQAAKEISEQLGYRYETN